MSAFALLAWFGPAGAVVFVSLFVLLLPLPAGRVDRLLGTGPAELEQSWRANQHNMMTTAVLLLLLLLRSTIVLFGRDQILCRDARLGWGVRFDELHGDWVLEWMRWACGSRKWFLSSTWW